MQNPGVRGNNQGANECHPRNNITHRDETDLNRTGQCNQATENARKESETRGAKHRAKVKQIPHFPPLAQRLWRAEQLVLPQS